MIDSIEDILKQRILDNGAISLSDFIDIALYEPTYGYYMTRDPLGVSGDFITAPEVSQMFGEMIGAWIADIWNKMEQPKKIHLIECGPGRGTLMSDILRITRDIKGLHDALHINLIECSPVLKKKQKNILSLNKVQWIENIDDIKSDAPVIIIGNEFLDALPVQQYKRINGSNKKSMIVYKNIFEFDWVDTQFAVPDSVPDNQIYEYNDAQITFIHACLDLISSNSGCCLFIDYGYFEKNYGETLQVLKEHQTVDLFDHIGHSDITSHVNFGEIYRHVIEAGGDWHGYICQGEFLKNLGIEFRAHYLKNETLKSMDFQKAQRKVKDLNQDLERLISHNAMGELFKVICFSKGININPEGFLSNG